MRKKSTIVWKIEADTKFIYFSIKFVIEVLRNWYKRKNNVDAECKCERMMFEIDFNVNLWILI